MLDTWGCGLYCTGIGLKLTRLPRHRALGPRPQLGHRHNRLGGRRQSLIPLRRECELRALLGRAHLGAQRRTHEDHVLHCLLHEPLHGLLHGLHRPSHVCHGPLNALDSPPHALFEPELRPLLLELLRAQRGEARLQLRLPLPQLEERRLLPRLLFSLGFLGCGPRLCKVRLGVLHPTEQRRRRLRVCVLQPRRLAPPRLLLEVAE